MANITRTNPTGEVSRFDPFGDPFDDFFRGFFLRPMGLTPRLLEGGGQFKVDVTENDKAYRVMAELPGVRKEDINVTIDGDEVAISAEVKKEDEQKDSAGRLVYSERRYGRMYRSFTLGEDVDQSKAEAKYTDGVLELVLPKMAESTSKKKRIVIH